MKNKKLFKKDVFVVLHNIRSAHNVGSVFRTAEAVGVSKIFLTGYTPSPKDRFQRPVKEIAKTALGAEEMVPWEKKTELNSLLLSFKENNIFSVAVEQSKKSIDYKKVKLNYPVVFLFGNEITGLSKTITDRCDVVADIPMRGKKESLNVAVAVGVALFGMIHS